MDLERIAESQRAFFRTGKTLDLHYRRQALRRLRDTIAEREADVAAALRADLNKSEFESYMCETGLTLSEIGFQMRHMGGWAKDRRVATPLAQFHAKSFTVQEPYGVTLVMSPWNYPFMLCMEPLAGVLAAGNCCVLKPSAYAPATSAVIRDIVTACFPPEYVTVVEGGRAENQALLDQKFDYIFFTGGVSVGRQVMEKAAQNLTPVTLELGGKSPCIVDRTAKLDLAAKRLAFGKLLNCGQTCVAPDYLLIDRTVKDEFLRCLQKWMDAMYGEDALENGDYVRMINRKHFDRVSALIDPAKVVYGGKTDPASLKIQPTILDNVTGEDAVMGEEIFGPVLPVIAFDCIDEAEDFILSRPNPLALYIFSQDKAVQDRFLRRVPFGGGCVNDTIIHLASSRMGFGGVGGSGMGSYHGKKSFDTFSHEKSIVNKSTWMDLPVRYAPYSDVKGRVMRRFLK